MTVCQHCGRSFTAERSTARYCGDTCRQGAHRGTTPPNWRRHWAEEDEPSSPPPSRRAWVCCDQWRWWVRVEGEPPSFGKTVLSVGVMDWDERYGHYWTGRRAFTFDELTSMLRDAGYAAVRLEGGPPLPPAWLLKLRDGSGVARGLADVLAAVPATAVGSCSCRSRRQSTPTAPNRVRPAPPSCSSS